LYPTVYNEIIENNGKLRRYVERKAVEVLKIAPLHPWETFFMTLPPKVFTYGLTLELQPSERDQVRTTVVEIKNIFNNTVSRITTPPLQRSDGKKLRYNN
jgi:hypothetical protein